MHCYVLLRSVSDNEPLFSLLGDSHSWVYIEINYCLVLSDEKEKAK
jgi:hypothetical protein